MRERWSNVSYGDRNAAAPEDLFASLAVNPDVYYHNRRYMRFNRVLEGLKMMERATGEKLDIAYPTSRKVFTHQGRVRWAPDPYRLVINPAGGRFASGERVEVTLKVEARDAEIRYTIDGTEPGADARLYEGPVALADSATMKARCFKDGKARGKVAAAEFVFMRPREPDNPEDAVPGLAYAYFHGMWDRLPEFEKLTPEKTGSIEGFDLGMRARDDGFGVVYSGFVRVEEEGTYTFFTRSDDGTRLWIGPDVVVENDGLHGTQERSGTIVLKAGAHALRVAFFEKTGGESLEVLYQGPGLEKRPVPPSALSRLDGAE
jgi:hypothetical protein